MSLSEEDGNLDLFNAVKNNNESEIRGLLDAGADVNITDESWKRTPLFYAVLGNFENVVRVLIKAGANVNTKDREEKSCLFFAVLSDHSNIARVLIGAKADVNAINKFQKKTPIFYAVSNGNGELVDALIDAGADVNKTDSDGQTALFCALRSKNDNIVRAIIDAGADVNKTEKYGRTALFIAVLHDNKSIVQALIDAGDDVNKTDIVYQTALFSAVRQDNESNVRALIDAGADVNNTDKYGETALFSAVRQDNESNVRALFDASADVHKTDDDGKTALRSVVRERYESIVRTLIDAGADVNKTDIINRTALFSAVRQDNESNVRALIDAGADVNKTDKYSKTALYIAVLHDNKSIVQALIDSGADVNKTYDDGETALLSAVREGNESVVQALIDSDADVNKTYDDGETALRSAVGECYESIVRTLIDAGADVKKTDNDGQTALFSAVRHDNESIVRALIDAGADVNKTDNDGQTALFCVSSSENSISLLIDAGADVNLPDKKGETPLFDFVRSQLEFHVKALVVKGKALINVRNHHGRTPLFYALQHSPVIARCLLENGGNLCLKDNCNLSILSFLIEEMLHNEVRFDRFHLTEQLNLLYRKGNTEKLVVKALIEVLFCKIVPTCTPLGEVTTSYSYFMHEGCLSEFLSMADDQTQMTIENILEQVSSEQLSQVVPSFVNLGADLNSVDSHGNTLLHYVTLLPFVGVSQTEVMETCHLLWKYGASMNIRNQEGHTPLLFCLSELSLHSEWLLRTDGVKMLEEVCRCLVNCGTNVNNTLPNGKSVFHLIIDLFQKGLRLEDEAVRQEVLNEMCNLLQLFSDANCKQAESFKNSSGHLYLLLHSWASLTLPSSENYSRNVTHNYTFEELLKAILQLLLKCGAKPNARDDDEKTPLHHCKTWSAVKLLIDAGAKTDDVDSSGHPTLLAAAERQNFLERSDCFYPDVLEYPKAFWRTAIKMNLDPWTVDQHENSVLSNMIKCKAFVLAKALMEVTCEDKHIESDTIAYSLLSTICKDQSTHTRWKTNLVEIILNSRKRQLVNLDVPLRYCCKNIVELGSSDDSSHDSLHPSKGLKRKFADNEFEKCGSTQPMHKKIKTADGRCEEKTDGQCSEEETDGQCSKEKTENAENSNDLVHCDSVHCEIAELLLSYGADCRIPDSSGKSCLDLAETCPELKQLLMQPIDMNKISKRIPWDSVSER
ncbi:serine/threonine-protein phosphatase 6 regulatory ankyrin repeat subunit C-like isoform X2 [Actinia tenebrosa]|uniref:Serine/threonine-protein phosphatase 6 regulatory ankyrin repeat subunit C-like isoform X2 n=1 Tax=Actinia tenebrosa TaxID=6105 RepID=A0A6P8HGM7_ACTTE|nr:serine/threonine-protein phosphatase 6 regulatory ankyrin repeat subunit C-like isoform X2 [Actinia tenebrosa]